MAGAFPGFRPADPSSPANCRPASANGSRPRSSDRGIDYVGQELVRLSTTPVWSNGRIAPRPFVLRVFAAATPDGWTIMPGGFCRIADQPDARAVSMGDGARSADVWVVSDKPVSTATLLPAGDTCGSAASPASAEPRRRQSVLARPLSRARRGDAAAGAGARHAKRDAGKGCLDRDAGGRTGAAAAGDMGRCVADFAVAAREGRGRGAAERGEIRLGSVAGAVGAADRDIACASGCRRTPGRSSPKCPSGWRRKSRTTTASMIAAELTLQDLASFAGLAQENMNRAAGWRFLEMGRRVERGINTVRFARQFAYDEAGSDDLDILLTWSIARSPIGRAIWSARCCRRCATSWCSIPIIPARSHFRSRR